MLQRSIDIVKTEIGQLKAIGPDQNILSQAVAQTIASDKRELDSNRFWFDYLIDQYRNNAAVDEIADREGIVNSLTIEDIRQTANELLINAQSTSETRQR
jgi:hypothetical protein